MQSLMRTAARTALREEPSSEPPVPVVVQPISMAASPTADEGILNAAAAEGLRVMRDATSPTGFWGVRYVSRLSPTPYVIDTRPVGGNGQYQFRSAARAAVMLARWLQEKHLTRREAAESAAAVAPVAAAPQISSHTR